MGGVQAVLLAHVCRNDFCADEIALVIHVGDEVKGGLIHFIEAAGFKDACVGNEDVDPSKGLDGAREAGLNRCLVGHIDFCENG